MTKEEFEDLLKRYTAGECSLEEIEKVNHWFSSIADETRELNEFEKSHVNERILSGIRQKLPSASPGRKVNQHTVSLILKIAASVLLIAIAGYFFFPTELSMSRNNVAHTPASEKLVEVKNATNDVLCIALPDSSVVKLEPGSELSYSKTWSTTKREVHLAGEAFFDVVKDSRRPFYVYGGDIVTKVLGTSFSVKAA